MKVTVADAGLARTLRRFRPRKNSKMEFNLHEGGLDIVANRDGWLTLARWCLLMAHRDMIEADDGHGVPHWHASDVLVDDAMLDEDRAIMAFWPLETNWPGQDVTFWLSDRIGRDFWPEPRQTGNSPMSAIELRKGFRRYEWAFDATRDEIERRLGPPAGEETYGSIVALTYFVDDFPGGRIEVYFGPDGKAYIGY